MTEQRVPSLFLPESLHRFSGSFFAVIISTLHNTSFDNCCTAFCELAK